MRRPQRAHSKPLSRMPGSTRSPPKSSAERCRALIIVFAAAAAIASCVDDACSEEQLRPYTVVGDAIPESLTGAQGDAERGRSIFVNRQVGLCLLLHPGTSPCQKRPGSLTRSLQTP